MSTDGAEGGRSDRTATESEAAIASAVFVVLLVTAVIWPRPVLWLNDLTFQAELSISTVSFLGREAPSWDVVYWGIVGLAVIGLFHGRLEDAAATWREVRRELSGAVVRGTRLVRRPWRVGVLIGVVTASVVCAVTWLVVDAPLMAQVSRIGSERVHDFVRLSNRLGGGGNPPMVAGFFVLAGLALRKRRWTLLGIAMALSSACAGILASALKPLVARSRPDLWLGAFSRVWGGESSFPSGHTISAFAITGAVFACSRSRGLRLTVLLAAISIASTRVIALRHWPSDVLVSAIVGALVGNLVGRASCGESLDEASSDESREAAPTART